MRKSLIFTVLAIFGNEWSMEKVIEKLKEMKNVNWQQQDRRYLCVEVRKEDLESVKEAIRSTKGYVESVE